MSRPAHALLFVALAAACGPAPAPSAPEPSPTPAPVPVGPPAPEACIAAGEPGHEPDTLNVVLDPPPRAELPPLTGAEWFAWASTYETLVRLDCSGSPRPALAAAWQREDDGRAWTVSLGESAVNSNGSRPAPETIVQAWQPLPERLALAGVTSVERRGARDLRFVFARPNDSLPAILADPALAFRRSALMPTDSSSAPALRILPPPPDLRDALDAGRDIVVTADPATLDYARRQPNLEVAPLPWSSVYALVAPEGSIAADDRLRSSLARDVVREDARPAPADDGRGGCAPGPARPAAPTERTRLAYVAADPTAASLAARLVALGAAGPRGAALALEQPEIRRRLQHGDLAGAVVPLPALAVANCGSADFAGYTVTPLVETRAHLIARRGGPAIRRDAFGVLRIDGGSASP